MPRIATQIDVEKLKGILVELEKGGPLPNQNQLFMMAAQKMGGITPAIIRLRVETLKIPIVTPKGKRGRQKGEGGPIGLRTSRAGFYKGPIGKQHITALRGMVPKPVTLNDKKQYDKEVALEKKCLKKIAQIEQGSIKAVIWGKCMDCANFSMVDIRECPCLDCPLWGVRPYK